MKPSRMFNASSHSNVKKRTNSQFKTVREEGLHRRRTDNDRNCLMPSSVFNTSQVSDGSDGSDAATDCAMRKAGHVSDTRRSSVSCLTTEVILQDDFASVSTLFGRDLHLQSIRDAYQRAASGTSEVFLVHGESGTGKSVLVNSMRAHVTSEDAGFFVSGKFDQLQTRREPFSAIASALSDICDLIFQMKKLDDRRREIAKALRLSNVEILSKVIPNLIHVTGDTEYSRQEARIQAEDIAQFHHACQQFLEAVATHEHPLFIFLDDMQWADKLSLELMKALIANPASQYILFCFAYRDDADFAEMFLHSDSATDQCLPCTRIQAENLREEDLSSMLTHLLQSEEGLVRPLASLLLANTRGNPNLVVQQLEILKNKQLLVYCDESYCWKWNINSIEPELSDTPAEIIAQKVNCLDGETREILQLGAYIGQCFTAELVIRILVREKGPDESFGLEKLKAEIRKGTQQAIQSGLIVEKKQGVFIFCHDSIQNFLHSSVNCGSEAELLHLRIGRALMDWMQEDSPTLENCSICLAANNMLAGAGHINEESERLAAMRLLLDAAKFAASKAGIADAKQYLECALKLQRDSDYHVAHSLCIDVRNLYAEVQSANGAFDDSNKAVDIVLKHSQSVQDKHRAICTKMRSLAAERKYDELFDLGFKTVLPSLGESMPRNPTRANALMNLFRLKRTLGKMKPEEFLSLPDMTDLQKLAAMKVLGMIGPIAFCCSERPLYLSCVARRLFLSIKYGISPHTATALAGCSALLRKMGKMDEAYNLGKVSVQLAERGNSSGSASICISTVTRFVFPWREPLTNLVQPMLESYKVALRNGDFMADAFYAISAYLEIRRILGAPLADLESDLSKICGQVDRFHAPAYFWHRLCLWQYVLNLLGRSEDVIVLSGEAMDWNEFESTCLKGDDDPGKYQLHIHRLRLQLGFEEWELVGHTLQTLTKVDVSYFSIDFSYLISVAEIALSSLVLCNCMEKTKFRRVAKRYTSMLRQWHKDGVPDAEPLWLLLQAEMQSTIVNSDHESSNSFDKAIAALKCSQLVDFECLGYQRAMYWMIKKTSIRLAHKYLTAALERNREWGNVAKVEFLQTKYAYILQSVRPTFSITVEKIVPLDEDFELSLHDVYLD